MPTVFRKAANWLGLVDDERYDYQPPRDEQDDVEDDPADEAFEELEPEQPSNVTVLHPDLQAQGQPERYRRAASGVAPVYPRVIAARSYEDAENIGETYRSGVPVMMNLIGMPTDQARRVLDFNTGLVFAMGGRLEKVAPRMFLLSPAGVEVSQVERDRVMAGLVRAA